MANLLYIKSALNVYCHKLRFNVLLGFQSQCTSLKNPRFVDGMLKIDNGN